MRFSEYLKDKSIACVLFIGIGILTGLFQASLLIELPVIIFSEVPFFAVAFVALLVDYRKRKAYYDRVMDAAQELDEKSYLAEVIQRPSFYEGRILYSVLKELGKDANDRALCKDMELEAYKEYIETWVHEVKLPISTSKLLISNNKNEITLSIEEEVDRIDNYVEQVLYYARSGNVEQDYHMEWFDLKPLVHETVKKYARSLIQAQVSPRVDDLDYCVLSDRKWVAFMLGQIIQNAVKYRKEDASIHFFARKEGEGVTVYVEDNGVGIPGDALPRVFDKGFTGENIRGSSKATGMGLYLCRRLCRKLGLEISIESEVSQWTRVGLHFPKGTNITKM